MPTTVQGATEDLAGTTAEEVWGLVRTLLGQQRRRFLIAAAEVGLHPAQAGALLRLQGGEPVPMNELAAQLACDNSNVTGLVDRLEGRGLVTREPSEQDRRVKHVRLTRDGARLQGQLMARIGRPPTALEDLPARDQQELARLLRRIVTGTDAD